MLRCDCIQRVVKTPISSSVRARVCVYQHATDVMAATTAETGPTNSSAVSHAQISLDLRAIMVSIVVQNLVEIDAVLSITLSETRVCGPGLAKKSARVRSGLVGSV